MKNLQNLTTQHINTTYQLWFGHHLFAPIHCCYQNTVVMELKANVGPDPQKHSLPPLILKLHKISSTGLELSQFVQG